ncbi:type II toxin-antitoxin system PemK/MazF family toxin [Halopenitus salinus]|uniref:Type II toxin-antitoxin system PemK/MazF family toxin n=1 Tax=Halopenitus salinus TaxID=1198295 RepID=A0ABD5UV36_9EURY
MSDDDAQPIFERGDVVYGTDPFKPGETSRPWLIVSNHEDHPFHGDQYLACTLTTKSWMEGVVEIPETGWIRGGTPRRSRIVPWGVQSIVPEDIERWQGRIEHGIVDEAASVLIDELRR